MDLKLTWPLPPDFVLERERSHQDPHGHIDQVTGFTAADLEESRHKTGADPLIGDPDTLGAVAAASVDESMMNRLAGCRFAGTVPITASLGVGTDQRDIWAACFEGEGFAIVIFMSPCCQRSKADPISTVENGPTWVRRAAMLPEPSVRGPAAGPKARDQPSSSQTPQQQQAARGGRPPTKRRRRRYVTKSRAPACGWIRSPRARAPQLDRR